MFLIKKNEALEKALLELENKKREVELAVSYIEMLQSGKYDNLNQVENLKTEERSILEEKLLLLKNHLVDVARAETERNWINEGLAHFAILLRDNHTNLSDYYHVVLSKLIKYVGANQGALFIYDQEEEVLEQVACYAYDRRKYLEKRILPGEGMVGAVFLEKETTYLTEVPKEYVKITSGLGNAAPRAILLVPLKLNEKAFGIIELACFKQLEKYKIEFVEKVAESIASSVSARQINDQTKALLEISKKQAEEMKVQEEQMRQNMEELSATQEEMIRKQVQLEASEAQTRAILEACIDTILTVDEEGIIRTVNPAVEQMFGFMNTEVLGQHIQLLIPKIIIENTAQSKCNGVKADKTSFPVAIAIKAAIVNNEKVFVVFVRDITVQEEAESEIKTLLEQAQQNTEELRAQEEELRQNLEELAATQEEIASQLRETIQLRGELQEREMVFGHTTILSESDTYGNIIFLNDKLCEVSKYTREELLGKPHNIFRHPEMPKELFKIFWETIKKGEVFNGIIKNKAKDGTHYWVDATIVPVKNDEGKIVKYIGARYHIQNDKLAEHMYKEGLQKLGLS